ncbi:hypothetical protein EDC01DRAFT_131762 [Geopyxis carbonaria]|nr:hypothetical protein EDC01DRAFT_131762 [Geopyxis carbonaria]
MSFKFNFGDADSDSETENDSILPGSKLQTGFLPPQFYTLKDLVSKIPCNLSYTSVQITHSKLLPRRELYDVRMQIMAEDNVNEKISSQKETSVGLGNEDILSQVYEGGLKTWECSIDLVKYLEDEATLLPTASRFLELGCGTALPSLYLFSQLLQINQPGCFTLTLADYNIDVLTLVTMPNLFLTWILTTQPYLPAEGDVDVTPALVDAFLADVEGRGIEIRFVSGGWCAEMVYGMGGEYDLILGSETIYSLGTMPAFVEVLLGSLKANGRGVVAAKKLYFGVGGSIADFSDAVKRFESWEMSLIREIGDAGVGRVIVEVKKER